MGLDVPAGTDSAGQELQQIRLEDPADVFDVVRSEGGIVTESLRNIALGPADHESELRAACSTVGQEVAYLIRNGTRKRAGLRLGSTGHVRHATAPMH